MASEISNHRAEPEPGSNAPESASPVTVIDSYSDEESPFKIIDCPSVYQLMEEKQLAWGVRFEIARLLSCGVSPEKITSEKLERLRGSNKDACPRIARVLIDTDVHIDSEFDPVFAQEMAASFPWEELDREEAALSEGPHEGIGNNPRLPGWYGGKVVFQGHLLVQDNGQYKVVLDSCSLGGSSRLTRRFGSWSFLRIKLPRSIFFGHNRDFIPFFLRPFIIWGRVYRVFDAKDSKIYLYWTNETGVTDPSRLSFEEFVDWHNPLDQNEDQLMTKWAARMTLGLSTSVPGPRILPENILSENDIVSPEGSDMTDGCGLTSKTVHTFLCHNLSLPSVPTAFQFRLAGYKGMSLLCVDRACPDNEMNAWLRPSQRKIKYADSIQPDPAKLTFDIIRLSHMRIPAPLSTEVLINLAENKVPSHVFLNLLLEGIRGIVQGLTSWDGPDAMFKLWINVERAGGVLSGRRARESIGEARVRGYSNKSPDEIDLEHDDDDEDDDLDGKTAGRRSTAWWADYTSGCPSSLEETVMVMIDAGFTPQTSPVLRDRLHKIVALKIDNCMQKVRFDVEQCCVAFAVPDPYNVLEEGEIQVKSSKGDLKDKDGLLIDTILGDVLVTRNPCKIPTDVRKVKAVEHPALRNLVDVVVFSVKGHRRLIDFLAGGDYDGDSVLVIWMDEIVTPFQNAHEKHATEPQGLDCAFQRDKETVAEFRERTANLSKCARREAIQLYLLGPLVDPEQRGKYSNLHVNAVYQFGYSNPRTVKLAYKFCRVLDAAKTGWRMKLESYAADLRQYDHRPPSWKEVVGKKKDKNSKPRIENVKPLERSTTSSFAQGTFIMDILVEAAQQEKERLLVEMERVFAPLPEDLDPDLIRPWDDFVEWSERGARDAVAMKRKDRDTIAAHVQELYQRHKSVLRPCNPRLNLNNSDGKSQFTGLPIEERQDQLRKVSKAFVAGPSLESLPTIVDEAQLARYRASYAYKYDAERKQDQGGWSRFPFDVAMRELCDIKARASGIHKVVQNSFYERFRLMDRR